MSKALLRSKNIRPVNSPLSMFSSRVFVTCVRHSQCACHPFHPRYKVIRYEKQFRDDFTSSEVVYALIITDIFYVVLPR